jgi:hypothetical protein
MNRSGLQGLRKTPVRIAGAINLATLITTFFSCYLNLNNRDSYSKFTAGFLEKC